MRTLGAILLTPVAFIIAIPILTITYGFVLVDFVQSLRGKR